VTCQTPHFVKASSTQEVCILTLFIFFFTVTQLLYVTGPLIHLIYSTKYMCVFGIVPTWRTWLHTHFPPSVCQNVLQTSLDPYFFSLSLVTFKQCCGPGTAGTITFCPSGIGTGMHYGSGTGFGSGCNIKRNLKSQKITMRGQFLGNKLLSDIEKARFCAILCQNRNRNKSLPFHNTAFKYVPGKR
jgi:hypothetical protein